MKMPSFSGHQLLFLAVSVLAISLLACNLNPVIRAPAPSMPSAEVMFTASEAVIALAADKDENVYAVTVEGNLFKIAPDGESSQLYSGLKRCGFSDRALTVLPNGDVIANDCTDNKDTLIRIDPEGNSSPLTQLEESLMSMTSDASGRLYLGFWTSEGDINVNFNPSYLAGADYLAGRVAVLGEDGKPVSLYEGGLPLSMAASPSGELYAAIWGQAGPFRPISKNYTMCGPTKNFWIGLSDQAGIQQLAPGQQEPIVTHKAGGVFSQLAVGKDGLLFAFGKVGEEECGIYQIRRGSDPQRLSFKEDEVQKNITSLAASDSHLYFADADGKLYRLRLEGLELAQEAPAAALETQATAGPDQLPAGFTPQAGQRATSPSVTPIPATHTPAPAEVATQVPSTPTPTTSLPTPPPLPAGSWQRIADLPRQINSLVADPGDPQVLYAATGTGSNGGVYKSQDSGLSWRLAVSGLPKDAVKALAFGPDTPPKLYAAVGPSGDIYASGDGAESWTQVGDNPELCCDFGRQMLVSPHDGNVLFVVEPAGGRGASYSRDGGQNWQAVQDERGTIKSLSLAIDATNAEVVYLGTLGNGVYKSSDGGLTWEAANRGMLDYNITALAVDPTHLGTVYAGGDRGELFKSTDGGESWSDFSAKLPYPGSGYIGEVLGITLDPASSDTIYLLVQGVGVLFSGDGGERWQFLGKPGGVERAEFTTMLVRFEPQLLLILGVGYEGAWRYGADNPAPTPTPTVPAGSAALPPLPAGSWQPLADLPRQINSLVADPGDPQVLYAATGALDSGAGVYKSLDGGSAWELATSGLPDEAVKALAFSSDTPPKLYAVVGPSGDIYASSDGAGSWSQVGENPELCCNLGRQLAVSPGDEEVLFAVEIGGGGGASLSRDGGENWQALRDERGELRARSLAIDPTDGEVIYLGTEGNGVYKSTDGGVTWLAFNRGMLDYQITALAVDPAHPGTVYAGGGRGELFKSTDGGGSWSDFTHKLPYPSSGYIGEVLGIALDPEAPETVYLLVQGLGVLISGDGGERWQLLGKPGGVERAEFTAMLVRFEPQLLLILGVKDAGGWRYAVD